jgi:hypothetical protein
MKEEITVSTHKSVGPFTDVYDHAPVIFIQEGGGENGLEISESLWVCLDCGFTDIDRAGFTHEECSREDNQVNQTLREYLEENEYPEQG